MRNKNLKFIFISRFILLVVLLSQPAMASEQKETQPTESNLIGFSYPAHSCGNKPRIPLPPDKRAFLDKISDYNTAVADYNVHVAGYNTTIKRYKSCINQYIKKGNHDINTIRKQLNKALKEARNRSR